MLQYAPWTLWPGYNIEKGRGSRNVKLDRSFKQVFFGECLNYLCPWLLLPLGYKVVFNKLSIHLTIYLSIFLEQIMSADKYPRIFSRQMEAIVYFYYTNSARNISENIRLNARRWHLMCRRRAEYGIIKNSNAKTAGSRVSSISFQIWFSRSQ